MIDRDHSERVELTEQDLAIAALIAATSSAASTTRRRASMTSWPRPPSSGDAAVDVLRTVLACYEAMRASEDLAR